MCGPVPFWPTLPAGLLLLIHGVRGAVADDRNPSSVGFFETYEGSPRFCAPRLDVTHESSLENLDDLK